MSSEYVCTSCGRGFLYGPTEDPTRDASGPYETGAYASLTCPFCNGVAKPGRARETWHPSDDDLAWTWNNIGVPREDRFRYRKKK
jgi:DNA-directed RNA polymerase subunit RPC12/RpoP